MNDNGSNNKGVGRRSFIKSSGHLLIGFSILQLPVIENDGMKADHLVNTLTGGPDDIDSWIQISANGEITVLTGKMELGQGIKTALKQMAAEELDVDIKRVRIIIADTALTQNEGYTAGSGSIERSGKAIRLAAAEAKKQLLLLASVKFNLSVDKLIVEDGVVYVADRSQSVSYNDLVKGKALTGKVSGNAPLKNPSSYKLVGKAIHRDDITDMVTGKHVFIHDLRIPGMVHARVYRPPTYEATLVSIPVVETESLPGIIKLVRNGTFIAVIAEEEYQAIKGLKLLESKSVWNRKPLNPLQKDLFSAMETINHEPNLVEKNDSVPLLISGSPTIVEAAYYRPYHMHASIGPSCALAVWKDDQLTVWSHTQGVLPIRRSISDLLNLTEEKIRVIGVPGSGCYGHNAADDVAADAALLAMQMPGKPVRVIWMREDEHRWEPYGPAMIIKIKAGLDNKGTVTAWDTKIWSDTHSTRPGGKGGHFIAGRHLEKPFDSPQGGFPGGSHRNSSPIYSFPAKQIQLFSYKGPLRTSALRSLGAYANIFALESFMDELAARAGTDPVEFRLKHLTDKRSIEVIQTLAEKTGWMNRKKVSGKGVGFAFSQYKNQAAYFGVVAEVHIDKAAKKIRVTKLTGCIDAGQTINSDGLKNQTEGGMIQATSWTIMEEVKFDKNGILSTNWHTYPIIRFAEVPDTEVHIIDRPDHEPMGAGEAAQGPTGAAIANAIFNATGKRLREMPLKYEKLAVE